MKVVGFFVLVLFFVLVKTQQAPPININVNQVIFKQLS